jgi:hypothetical protein
VQILLALINIQELADKWISFVELHFLKVENLLLPLLLEPKRVPRIVPYLKEGAGSSNNQRSYSLCVTEYGVAYLYGKT